MNTKEYDTEYSRQLDTTRGTPTERYEKEALIFLNLDRQACSARLRTDESVDLIHASMGISDEAGEFSSAVKRAVYYGKPLDRVNAIEELGDLLWYINLAAKTLGVNLDLVMAANLRKLRTRYGVRFTEAQAHERDRNAERKALESVAQPVPDDEYAVEF